MPPPAPAPAAVRDTRFARLWRDIADLAAGVAFLHAHRLLSIDGVFRIAASVNPAFDAFIASGDAERIVELGPPRDAAPELKGTSHRVRLLRYTFADTEFRLATTLLDSGRHPAPALADLCHGRWSIEELYKSTKDMIGAFHAKSERGVRQELCAAFVLETIGRLFSNRAEDPLPPMRANGRNTMRLVGRSIEQMFLTANAVVNGALAAVLAGIRRCVQRERPNRSYDRVSRKPRRKWTGAAAN